LQLLSHTRIDPDPYSTWPIWPAHKQINYATFAICRAHRFPVLGSHVVVM